MFEKLVYDSLYSYLVSCNLLNPNQSGFRPGDSTVSQLISITHTIFKAFDCNPSLDVRSVYLDISKAFDRVWHDGLIYKLKRCGVSGKLLSLIQSSLKDRIQRTGDAAILAVSKSVLRLFVNPIGFCLHANKWPRVSKFCK